MAIAPNLGDLQNAGMAAGEIAELAQAQDIPIQVASNRPDEQNEIGDVPPEINEVSPLPRSLHLADIWNDAVTGTHHSRPVRHPALKAASLRKIASD
jgi:hypothetical protein